MAGVEHRTEEGLPRTPALVYMALVFALLGFACGVPAVVGLILGVVGRRQATVAGAGIGLATAAIIVSLAWLVLFLILILVAQTDGTSGAVAGAPA